MPGEYRTRLSGAWLEAVDPCEAGFAAIAGRLLSGAALAIGGAAHRLLEVEVYYDGPGHRDPFAHGHPLQRSCGRWYFHRQGASYRGGTYKGLDITFGPPEAAGGILIRSLETPDGRRINGSALCVEHILRCAGAESVAALDAALGAVWAPGPLRLVPREDLPRRPVLATARVGLTLKRAAKLSEMPAFWLRPYRFLTDPRIPKGRVHTVIALHQAGQSIEAIVVQTGSTRRAVAGYQARYEAGLAAGSLEQWVGRGVKTADLCEAHGVWQRRSQKA